MVDLQDPILDHSHGSLFVLYVFGNKQDSGRHTLVSPHDDPNLVEAVAVRVVLGEEHCLGLHLAAECQCRLQRNLQQRCEMHVFAPSYAKA